MLQVSRHELRNPLHFKVLEDVEDKKKKGKRRYYRSSDVDVPFRVHVAWIETRKFGVSGDLVGDAHGNAWDAYVTCQLFCNGSLLCLAEQTCHHSLVGTLAFNEWITLPITIDALPLNTMAVLNVWDYNGKAPVCLGGTTIPVFRSTRKMVKGRRKAYLWPRCEGDGINYPSNTPWNAARAGRYGFSLSAHGKIRKAKV